MPDHLLLSCVVAMAIALTNYGLGFYWGRRVGIEVGAQRERVSLVKIGALERHWLPGLPFVCPPAPRPRKTEEVPRG